MFIELFTTFFRIGLFTFGGGYAMIPLIQREIETRQWLAPAEFLRIIAIAEMTPGAIGVNTATFVGFRVAGFFGALFATFALILPSFLLIIGLSAFFERSKETPSMQAVLAGIKPAVGGLILAAAIRIGKQLALTGLDSSFFGLDPKTLVLSFLVFVAVRKYGTDPISVIGLCAVLGLIFFS